MMNPPNRELFDEKNNSREIHNLYRDLKYSHIVEELKQELELLQQQAADTPA
jgi:hypothetical protein